MARVLTCRDVGMDCDFAIHGETEEEVLEKVKEHARKDHGVKKITKDCLESWRKEIRNDERPNTEK